jgi:hypothetical protein
MPLEVLVLTVAILVLFCVMWIRECRFRTFGYNEQAHKKREGFLELRNLLLGKGILRECVWLVS